MSQPGGQWQFGLDERGNGRGVEKSQRDFIIQPGVDAQRLRRVNIQNDFYPNGVSSVLTGDDATRSG
jgi:hypothetical protein